ncbi:MAG: hypothetical protein ACI4JC_01090 [Faecalibacterium sp.]
MLMPEDALVVELEKLFDGALFPTSGGGSSPIHIYKHAKPEKMSGAAEATEPYISVCLTSGEIRERDQPSTIAVGLGIFIYNASLDHAGYDDLMSIIRRIQLRFMSDPFFGGRYECKPPLQWKIDDTTRHPFYIAAVAFSIEIAQPIYQEVPHYNEF